MYMEIKEDLIKLPDAIRKNEETLYANKNNVEELELQKKMIEESVSIDVFNAEVDGKKEFSNDLKRKLEINRRLQNGEEYQKLSKGVIELKKSIVMSQIELEYLKRKFRTAEALTRM